MPINKLQGSVMPISKKSTRSSKSIISKKSLASDFNAKVEGADIEVI
jgi:hypothetical protein